ncbi:hypothetical protein FOA52_000348 [Chlamydomonas sp. UWO 241]|nr:hypothetical protein FOA52_000348 [Chlamydomonas sp. UWO 241]
MLVTFATVFALGGLCAPPKTRSPNSEKHTTPTAEALPPQQSTSDPASDRSHSRETATAVASPPRRPAETPAPDAARVATDTTSPATPPTNMAIDDSVSSQVMFFMDDINTDDVDTQTRPLLFAASAPPPTDTATDGPKSKPCVSLLTTTLNPPREGGRGGGRGGKPLPWGQMNPAWSAEQMLASKLDASRATKVPNAANWVPQTPVVFGFPDHPSFSPGTTGRPAHAAGASRLFNIHVDISAKSAGFGAQQQPQRSAASPGLPCASAGGAADWVAIHGPGTHAAPAEPKLAVRGFAIDPAVALAASRRVSGVSSSGSDSSSRTSSGGGAAPA